MNSIPTKTSRDRAKEILNNRTHIGWPTELFGYLILDALEQFQRWTDHYTPRKKSDDEKF